MKKFHNIEETDKQIKFYSEMRNVKSKRISIDTGDKKTFHRAYMMDLSLEGDEELLKFAYDSGVGEKSAQGFGTIGFVGLVIPHMIRILIGADHRHLLSLSFLNGASLLVICDLVSRTVIAPIELPIGVITSFIGAPVFAYIFFKQRRKGGA